MRAIAVGEASQVAEARRAATALAKACGFDECNTGRVAIVATELSTNLIKHGGGGGLLVDTYEDATGTGIELLALDRGAGMEDVASCLRDGHSTAGSCGTGLGAIVRGAQVTDIYSVPGGGTAILARLAAIKGRQPQAGGQAGPGVACAPSHGAVSVAIAGEEICGDGWCHAHRQAGWLAMVADGLGHGPYAAEAAHAAQRCFNHESQARPSEMLAAMHTALRPTRGAAISIVRLDPDRGEIVFAGVGNVAAVIADHGGGVRRMVSHNGTIGHIARHMRDFTYPIGDAALVVLASDGLATSWRLDAYPGLSTRHPSLIAGVLYRDFARGRDDVTVLVCRVGPA